MNTDMSIYLDLDGVLVDFVGGLCRWYGLPDPYEWPGSLGEWDCFELMGLSKQQGDAAMDDAQFWRELSPMHDMARHLEAADRGGRSGKRLAAERHRWLSGRGTRQG